MRTWAIMGGVAALTACDGPPPDGAVGTRGQTSEAAQAAAETCVQVGRATGAYDGAYDGSGLPLVLLLSDGGGTAEQAAALQTCLREQYAAQHGVSLASTDAAGPAIQTASTFAPNSGTSVDYRISSPGRGTVTYRLRLPPPPFFPPSGASPATPAAAAPATATPAPATPTAAAAPPPVAVPNRQRRTRAQASPLESFPFLPNAADSGAAGPRH